MIVTLLLKSIVVLKKNIFDPIINGMQKAVSGKDGTAKTVKTLILKYNGKTGTAQNPHGDDHSIFIAFAPKKKS